jgi:putative MATE family efflux protein
MRTMILPFAAAYFVLQVNLFSDMAWCAGLGSAASAAISSMAPVYWLVYDIGIGFGATAAIARRLGTGEHSKANSMGAQLMVFAILISIIATPLIYLMLHPVISFIGAESIEGLCMEYILPIVISTPIITLNGVTASVMRAEGAARRSMIFVMTDSILNMILDPILIYGFGLGLTGAGIATALSTAIATAIGLYWYFTGQMAIRPTMKGYRVRPGELWNLLFVGMPKFTERTISDAMSIIQRVFVIACAGTVGVAVFNIPLRLLAVGLVPATAIGAALTPICAAELGKNDYENAKTCCLYATGLTLGLMLCVTAFVLIAAELLVVPFTYSGSMEALRPQFVSALRIFALMIPAMGLIEIGSSMFQALRESKKTLIASSIRSVTIVFLFAWASTQSMSEICWSLFAAETAGGLFVFAWAGYDLLKKERGYRADVEKENALAAEQPVLCVRRDYDVSQSRMKGREDARQPIKAGRMTSGQRGSEPPMRRFL